MGVNHGAMPPRSVSGLSQKEHGVQRSQLDATDCGATRHLVVDEAPEKGWNARCASAGS
jgi:hypothetical protein